MPAPPAQTGRGVWTGHPGQLWPIHLAGGQQRLHLCGGRRLQLLRRRSVRRPAGGRRGTAGGKPGGACLDLPHLPHAGRRPPRRDPMGATEPGLRRRTQPASRGAVGQDPGRSGATALPLPDAQARRDRRYPAGVGRGGRAGLGRRFGHHPRGKLGHGVPRRRGHAPRLGHRPHVDRGCLPAGAGCPPAEPAADAGAGDPGRVR